MYISVCVPTFNRLTDLKNCYASISAAVDVYGEPVEVLISDNSSPDGTDKWLRNLKPSSDLINLCTWSNEKNIGGIANQKKLIQTAKGEYIIFVTDDDLLLPNALDLVKKYVDSDSPNFIKFALTSYLVKSKKCYYYGLPQDVRDNDCSSNLINIAYYSHILSGCVFRNTAKMRSVLLNANSVYLSMIMCASSAGQCIFIAQPVVFHQWENEIFWDQDIDMSSANNQKKQLDRDTQLAYSYIPDGFLSKTAVVTLYESFLKSFGYIEKEIEQKFGKASFTLHFKCLIKKSVSKMLIFSARSLRKLLT